MPPKKQQKANVKTEQKKKEKIADDKTFGLKNKKGGKQQRFIKTVNQQVKFGGTPSARKQELLREEERKKKEDKKKGVLDEIDDALFRPVVQQSKIGKGADPKSVLCAFFKQGSCGKGAKCKFSHDLAIERKSEKRSLYVDAREDENDTMDDWDENKLKEVVEKKQRASDRTKTEKVCKFFLQAIEGKKYGWFWVCPNGGDECMYKHALPPGFILKSDKKKMEDQVEKISIEDLIERERLALGANVTKITLQSFLKWKKKKHFEKLKNMEDKKEKRKNEYSSGMQMMISGREMFEFQPDLVDQDDEGADNTSYAPSKEQIEEDLAEKVKDISLDAFTLTDNTPQEGISGRKPDSNNIGAEGPAANLNTEESNETQLEEDVPVDEDLFTEDLDDLDDIDD